MARSAWLENLVLRPLSVLYGMGVSLRNAMFKWGVLKQREFPVPLIVIGNLAVGGTGKTPHTEMIVDLLRPHYNVAVLSRGYKRSTKGFVTATPRSTPADIGDEPYQIYHKFGCRVPVVVCEKRVQGVEEIMRLHPEVNLIILDDAFQHRYIKPTVSVVLTEFDRPAYEDRLLPLGHLREPFKAMERADMVIVTKCPAGVKPIEYRVAKQRLRLKPFQDLYFSSFRYDALRPVFPEAVEDKTAPSLQSLRPADSILALSGIANPRPFVLWLRRCPAVVKTKTFPDHHNFQRRDLEMLSRLYAKLPGDGRHYIVTTEKDAVRLANNPYFPDELKPYTFYQPITVYIHDGEVQKPLLQAIEAKLKKKPMIKNQT